MKIGLVTPPMSQINAPYPATPYLYSYFKKLGYSVSQFDFSLELFLKLFSADGLKRIRSVLIAKNSNTEKNLSSDSVNFFLDAFDQYVAVIDPVIQFLQLRDQSLALSIVTRNFLPEGPRFLVLEDQKKVLKQNFGKLSMQDFAKYLAGLFLDDIADVIKEGIDPDFAFARYGEKLAASQISFTPMYERLHQSTLIDTMLEELILEHLLDQDFPVMALTVPFPGNMLGALRIAKFMKQKSAHIKIVMGGGFVNTELRTLSDVRLFEFIDYLIFDDGEKPLEILLDFIAEKCTIDKLLRTKYLKNNLVMQNTATSNHDVAFKHIAAPDYTGLDFKRYITMMEAPTLMNRLWSDFKWNKMILAHGCYWKKCTFCDVSLDYIQRFEPQKASRLVDYMDEIFAQTQQRGFHFVDEAAPPMLLKALAEELIKRGRKYVWWSNIRFDQLFNPELTALLSYAGCIAVTGGLEVAGERLLQLINKGVTLEQVVKVTHAFSRNNIFVHAYLMYGFPTQTVQETIDSLEFVRQLFKEQFITSAFWHRFSATVHSPVGKNPSKFNIQIHPIPIPDEGIFASNDLVFTDPLQVDHDALGAGLRKALYNYMMGIGIDFPLSDWFEIKVPKTKLAPHFVKKLSQNL